MSTLRELDASAEAAEACERAAVSLKRATRDVEASARGFGLEPNAVARARQLCAEVTRLASRADAAIAAAQDAAALEASRTIHDAFLTPAEDRAATRERLASAPAEPVRVHLVRFRDPKSASANAITAPREAPTPFLFHRRRAPAVPRRCDPDADARSARDAMRALLIEVRKKLDAPTAVAGLFRADGARVLDPRAVRDGETLVAKMASDERLEGSEGSEGDDASSYAPLTRGVSRHTTVPGGAKNVASVVSRLAAANARRDSARAARHAFAADAKSASPPGVAEVGSVGFLGRSPLARPASAPAKAPASGKKTQSAKDAELARPKPVWVRSFAVRLRVRAEDAPANVGKIVSMRVPEKGLEGMSLVTLRRRVALACGFKPGAALTLRLSPGRTELRHPAELKPGCALAVFADSKTVTLKKEKAAVPRRETGVTAESSPALDFAPSSPAGKASRARVERLVADSEAGLFSGAKGKKNKTPANDRDADLRCSPQSPRSAFGLSAARSSRRNPYGADPMAFADGRFDFSPVATSPRPPRKPDRFPMTALTAKDLRLRRASKPPVAKPKPVVGEYCFGSRIRFDPSMLPPARRFAVAGERAAETKKKMKKKKTAAKKAAAAAAKKKTRRSERNLFARSKKPLRETEKHAEEERAKDATRLGADARRLPPKTPIRDFAKSNAFDVLQMENDDASATPTSSRAEDEITSARLFFDALAAEPSIRNPQSES
jgi:hypothetical protein